MAEAKKEPKKKPEKKPDMAKELMDKLVMTLAIAEQKMDLQVENMAETMAAEVAKVDASGKRLREEVELLKGDKRVVALESAANALRKDLSDHQNKMKGVDLLKAVCDQHESMLVKMHEEIVDMRKELMKIPLLQDALKAAKKEISDLKAEAPKAEERLSVSIKTMKGRLEEKDELDKEKFLCIGDRLVNFSQETKMALEELGLVNGRVAEKLEGMSKRVESVHLETCKGMSELASEQRRKQSEIRDEMSDQYEKFQGDREHILDKLESMSFVSKRCDLVEKRVEKIFYDLKEVRVHLNI